MGGGRTGGGRGGAATGPSGDVSRVTAVQWIEVRLPAAGSTTPDDGGKAETHEERLKKLLRIHSMDPRPVFLYFHYGHEDVKKQSELTVEGKAAAKQCGVMAEDEFTRWGPLVRCVEVDMDRSDRATAELLGLGAGPSFALVAHDLSVIAKTEDFATGKTAAAFIRSNLSTAKAYSEYWQSLQTRMDEQKAALAKARELAKQKKPDEALAAYDLIRFSELRIGEFFDDACREAEKIETQLAEKKSKSR
jgi:hypothetical protein